MNYIEMSKICESCREVNNTSCMGCEQCKNCKKLDSHEKIRMNNSFNMKGEYKAVDNVLVKLEVDKNDLIIRIPYLEGDAMIIKKILMRRRFAGY